MNEQEVGHAKIRCGMSPYRKEQLTDKRIDKWWYEWSLRNRFWIGFYTGMAFMGFFATIVIILTFKSHGG